MSKYAQQAKATKKKRKVSKLGKAMSAAQKAKIKKASLLGKAKPMSDAKKTARQQRLRKLSMESAKDKRAEFVKKLSKTSKR